MTAVANTSIFRTALLAFRSLLEGWPPRRHHAKAIRATRKDTGFVSLVGAGAGSADLITLRGAERISEADVIYYDRLADPALLNHARPGARRVYVGKAPGCHSVSQHEINALLVAAAQNGQRVVRLKCGDPGIFARGAEEAEALSAAGVGWEIVPGVTSACAAAAAAGGFLTARGQTDRVIMATGQLQHDGAQDWSGTARAGTTLALYMGVAQADRLMAGLLNAGWPADAEVEVISRAQTPEQMVFRCDLKGLAALCSAHQELNPAMVLLRWPMAKSGAARSHVRAALLAQDIC